LLQATGEPAEAIGAYRTAVAFRPDYGEAHVNLGVVLEEFGDLQEALSTCRRAIQLKPNDPSAYNNLGIALLASGEREQAARALNRAIEIAPDYGKAHYNLAQILYCEADPEPSAKAFAKALDSDHDLAMAHFYLGIIRDQQGKHEAASLHFKRLADHPRDSRHLADSWRYAKAKQRPSTRYHGDTFETLKFGLDQARVDGMVLEFGVRFGNSINFIAKNVDRAVHGFDSFQGLPEAWERHLAGTYTTGGRLPEVAPNVRLHVGLFADTLPGFLAENAEPVRLMNVDCDLYSSTKTIFDSLADRIVSGTIIVFDEYLINPTWRQDEFRAFQETVETHSWNYEYLAFNLFSKQAAVRIL
jgi:Flp pilus assembly protein TadD